MFTYKIDKDTELKLLDMNHAEEIFKSINSNREHLSKYLPWVDSSKTVDDTREFIQASKKQNSLNNGFNTGIWYKGDYAGTIGFHSIDKDIKAISIGYWLDEKFVGKGLMTKACKVLIDYAFEILQMNRVEIRCAEDNYKSRAIPQRLGFIQEGIIRDDELIDGEYLNSVVYGMLKKDWMVKEGLNYE